MFCQVIADPFGVNICSATSIAMHIAKSVIGIAGLVSQVVPNLVQASQLVVAYNEVDDKVYMHKVLLCEFARPEVPQTVLVHCPKFAKYTFQTSIFLCS
jgi:hypothetical protein